MQIQWYTFFPGYLGLVPIQDQYMILAPFISVRCISWSPFQGLLSQQHCWQRLKPCPGFMLCEGELPSPVYLHRTSTEGQVTWYCSYSCLAKQVAMIIGGASGYDRYSTHIFWRETADSTCKDWSVLHEAVKQLHQGSLHSKKDVKCAVLTKAIYIYPRE